MFARMLKIAAVASVATLATAGASFAATWAWVDHDATVRANHTSMSPGINYVEEGDKVRVIASWGNWYKIKIPGPDGWVKANVLDFDPPGHWTHPGFYDGDGGFGGSFCVNGSNASFCLGGHN